MSEEARTVQKGKRSPRHVKAAARILQKEARKILRRHGRRIAMEPTQAIEACVGAIDDLFDAKDWGGLEDTAEKLDELLHQHASFARKSALRETIENILIAVIIALGLRSCLYEPFKIPSGSMMPTLRAGDHIFVNKFVYGIQIPFTTTVVGESLGEIRHGDVIVFRYPLDQSEDFIKRVVGLPGDEIKVEGRKVSVKRAGEETFAVLERTKQSERCHDETGTKVVSHCQLYEESTADASYIVRYMTNIEERPDLAARSRVWKVPAGHLFVMGDNRNQSHDSLAWTVQVEAVSADGLLSVKDLRDLTEENLFTQVRPHEVEVEIIEDPEHDHLVYMADHRSERQDIALSVWRQPVLGVEPIFETAKATLVDPKPTTVADLIENSKRFKPAARDRISAVGAEIDRMVVSQSDVAFDAVVLLGPAQTVLQLRCGRGSCKRRPDFAKRITDVVAQFHKDHDQDAREVLEADRSIRYTQHWTGRGDRKDRYLERRFSNPAQASPKGEVRLRAWRHPDEDLDFLRTAVLHAWGTTIAEADKQGKQPDDSYLLAGPDAFRFLAVDHTHRIVIALSCGRQRCGDEDSAEQLADELRSRIPAAARDRRRFHEILGLEDVGEWSETPVRGPERYEYDHVALEGTVRGPGYTVELEVWLRPPGGPVAKLEALRAEDPTLTLEPEEGVSPGALAGEDSQGYVFALPIPASEALVWMRCNRGLCPTVDNARELAVRVADKARDPSNFIDPDAERPKPFVPRGNVKGRADRIWLPFSRFWLPIK